MLTLFSNQIHVPGLFGLTNISKNSDKAMEWRLIEKIRVGNYFPRSAVIFGINNGWSSLSDK